MRLNYAPLEEIKINKPVNRISYLVSRARDKCVLDIGCYDETALLKIGAKYWLHEEVSRVAAYVLGMDNSRKIPPGGISTNGNSRIIKADIQAIDDKILEDRHYDLIIMGELIEHLPGVLEVFTGIKNNFQGRELICSTPNATSLSNVILAIFKRESTHHDHLQAYSYKILNTLCIRAGFTEWEIIPYHVRFTEMILKSKGIKKALILIAEKVVNFFEYVFPLLSGGFILNVKKI